jgi:GH15 family glucan-1,4-alpha-glucosidase
MIYTGKITGSSIEVNIDTENNVRMLDVEVTDENDVQGIEQVLFAGDDIGLVDGATAIILKVSEVFKIVIGVRDGIEPSMGEGERKIYSQSGGSIKAYTNYLKDGIQELNGNNDFITAFNEMKTAFDQMKGDLNGIINAWNAFATAYAPGGPSAVGTPPSLSNVSTSSADMSGAKCSTLKVKV